MIRTRRTAAAALIAALATSRPAPVSSAPREFDEPARGVVLLVADDLGGDLLGTCGEPGLRTPHLDRLAARGTQFPLAFASSSTCSPSRASLYTGLPSHQNGQFGIAHGTSHFVQFDQVVTLPEASKAAGAFIGWIGKSHVLPSAKYPVDWEWDGDRRDVAAIGEAASDFFRAAEGAPFLLIVGFADAHRNFGAESMGRPGTREIENDPARVALPRALPDRAKVREEVALYWRAISRLDQAVGAASSALEASGRGDETLVVFTSDNGAPFPAGKTNLTDAGLRLPFVVCNPVQIRRGVVCEAMIVFTDVVPTVLEWMRVARPRASKAVGRSLLPILEQTSPPAWNEVYASQSFHEVTMYYPMRSVRTRTHRLIVNFANPLPFPIAEDVYASPTWQGILHHPDPTLGGRPLAEYIHRPRVELYDLGADPGETRNLAEEPAMGRIRRDLEERLREWQMRTDDPWFVKYSHE